MTASSTARQRIIAGHGPAAASTRVRLHDWCRYLGIETQVFHYAGLPNNRPTSVLTHVGAIARAEVALRTLDVAGQRVIISREASPFSRGATEERLLRLAAHGVYDFDDAVFDDPSPARRALRTGDKCRRATAAADVVIAGNDYLADWAAQHNADVRMIPSCVDPDDYRPKTDWSIIGHAPSIVWLGSPSTERYVAGVTPALLQAHRQTGATLTLISGPRTNPALDQLNHMIRRVPWTLDSFAKVLAGADAAIAPLDGSKYSLGKCAYKLLQYAAAGLPMIGSPVGANELALHRFDGLVARSTDEWIGGLSELLTESCSRRAERGMTARSAVQAHYSFQAWAAAWSAATGFTGATLRASEA